MSKSLRPHWILQAKILGLPFPFPGDLPNPRIELRSPTLQMGSLPTEPQGKPKNMEWVAYPFSNRSSQPRNQTRVSCFARRFFYQLGYDESACLWEAGTRSTMGRGTTVFCVIWFLKLCTCVSLIFLKYYLNQNSPISELCNFITVTNFMMHCNIAMLVKV